LIPIFALIISRVWYALDKKFHDTGTEHCFISEIALAELKFGVENSTRKAQNQQALDDFCQPSLSFPL
jgi:predicted nucleic acid-binding protein